MKISRWDASAQSFAAEKMQKVGLFASDSFFLDLYCLEPGQSQKAHAHEGSDKVYLRRFLRSSNVWLLLTLIAACSVWDCLMAI